MPTISKFNGYRITMNYNDHLPPHIHVEYQDKCSIIDINKIKTIKGDIKEKDLKIIYKWMELHQDELLNNWTLAMNHEQPLIIKPYK